MAKIYEETLTVTISTLMKSDDESHPTVFDDDLIQQITEVFEQLIGSGKVVEVAKP